MWTLTLALFVALVVAARFQWRSLLIVGAILMWYGLVMGAMRKPRVVQRPARTGLN
jgi:hypothetical protein